MKPQKAKAVWIGASSLAGLSDSRAFGPSLDIDQVMRRESGCPGLRGQGGVRGDGWGVSFRV